MSTSSFGSPTNPPTQTFLGNTGLAVGSSTPLASDILSVYGAVSDAFHSEISLYDTTTLAAGIGGAINFGGQYISGTYTQWAGVQGTKLNSTSADYQGMLLLKTRGNADQLATRVTIDNVGRVGIGTTPSFNLHVKPSSGNTIVALDSVSLPNTGAANYVDFRYQNLEKGFVGFGNGDNNFYVANDLAGDILFYTNAIEYMRIDSVGKVGINTTDTSQNYRVRINATNNLGLSVYSTASGSAGYFFLENDVPNTWQWAMNGSGTANANKLTLEYSGGGGANIITYDGVNRRIGMGIDTVSTGFYVEIQQPDLNYALKLSNSSNSNFIRFGTTNPEISSSGTAFQIRTIDANPLEFWTNSVEAMRISSTGQVGIGTTPSQLLHLVGAAASTNYFVELDCTSTSGQGGFYTNANISGTQAGMSIIQFGSATGGTTAGISQNGMARILTEAPVTNLMIGTFGAHPVYFITNDILAVEIDSTQHVSFTDGSAASPSITFLSQPNTGMFYAGGNRVALTANGSQMITVQSGVVTVSGYMLINDGSAAQPTYAFTNASTTGMYHGSSADIHFAHAGTDSVILNSGGIYPAVDNTQTNGNASFRWSNLYAVTVHSGDVCLENDWRITEGDKVGHPEEGIMFLSPDGKKYKIAMTEVE